MTANTKKLRLQQLQYIQATLNSSIEAVTVGTIYTPALCAAMACRETGELLVKLAAKGLKPPEIWSYVKGDYTQRRGETGKSYHGFGPWQIDVNTDPAFIRAGTWQNPTEAAKKWFEIMESKRSYLIQNGKGLTVLQADPIKAIVAAYNTGQGNVLRSLKAGKSVDATTAGGDYAADVLELRDLYLTL